MSTASDIIARVRTTVATVSGLSSDKVIRGRPNTLAEGGSPPVAWVFLDSLTSSYGPDLTSYQRDLTVGIVAVGASGSGYGTREDAALTLLDGIYAALEADTTLLGYLTIAPVLSGEVGIVASMPGVVGVEVRIQCQYQMEQGGGL